jgi:hypothetical protein
MNLWVLSDTGRRCLVWWQSMWSQLRWKQPMPP